MMRLVISGRVQGVGYRAWTVEEARKRGLSGWVRNRMDGTVEAVFSGAAEAVAEMHQACLRGPPLAKVFDIQRLNHEETVTEGRFEALPTT